MAEREDQVLIACRMLENEVREAMRTAGCDIPVIWLEKGLHTNPDNLRKELQKTIDETEERFSPDIILLGYGFCGNAMSGLCAKNSRLVLPRIDDCITMFIGSRKRKTELEGGVGTIFQTCCRSDGDDTLLEQYQGFVEEYGEEDAKDLFDMIYGNYKRLGVLDTHCFPLEPVVRESRHVAEELGFEHEVFDASNNFIVELLSGKWDTGRFIVKESGEEISTQDLHAE